MFAQQTLTTELTSFVSLVPHRVLNHIKNLNLALHEDTHIETAFSSLVASIKHISAVLCISHIHTQIEWNVEEQGASHDDECDRNVAFQEC